MTKKFTMIVVAGSYQEYANWYTHFCPIPESVDKVMYLSETDKIRGFDRDKTKIYLLGKYWEGNVDTRKLEDLGYEIQGYLHDHHL